MLARLGDRLAAAFRATAPDPFVISVLLTVVAGFAATWAEWSRAGSTGIAGIASAAGHVLEWWRGGLWDLLGFGMEMCLILVTGHALAASPIVARGLRGLASLAHTPRQGALLTASVAMCTALVNWGFGLIVGAILARNVIDSLRDRNIDAPRGLIAGAGYLGLMVWHGGLSGSAPLGAASAQRQLDVLGPELGAQVGAIPVTQTTFSALNLVTTPGLVVIALLVIWAMAPRPAHRSAARPAPVIPAPAPSQQISDEADAGRFPRWLERSPIVVWAIAVPGLVLVGSALRAEGLGALDLGLANLAFFSLGLVLHGSARSYVGAVEDGARGCAGIIIQFPLYAGIMGMVQDSGLGTALSQWVVGAAGTNQGALGTLGFLSACLVNLFIPSGGGQWAVQGPVFMRAAVETGMNPGRMVMAISYGDQLTNMLQPFWALPLLAITRVPAREIVGYTAIAMLAGIAWVCLCLMFY